jgi:hypothetical protein
MELMKMAINGMRERKGKKERKGQRLDLCFLFLWTRATLVVFYVAVVS